MSDTINFRSVLIELDQESLTETVRPSLEKNKKCENECKINVGDLMTLKLEPQGLGAAIKDFNEYFT